jgi:hypothetical protein
MFSHLWLRAYNYRFKSIALRILEKNPELFEEEIEKEIFLSTPSICLARFIYANRARHKALAGAHFL